ncbi:MAG: tetratricopeptide repeat protein [Kiritimatiellae bacterium]|nr:tetratricopeptide repeat protein [Kiritimatiellia bacterium]
MSDPSNRVFPSRAFACAAAALLLALPCESRAQSAEALVRANPELGVELKYITRLNEAGFPEYAEMAIRDVEKKFPEARVIVKVAKLEQLLRLGKFDEAKAIIAAEKDQQSAEVWGMKLTMADYLYAYGKYPEALGIYKALLDKYGSKPDAALGDMYANSIYKYAQMLCTLGKERDALAVYAKLPDLEGIQPDTKRMFTFEYAQLLVKVAESGKTVDTGMLQTAQTTINKLMWQQDIWFGRAVALMAHIRMAQGNVDGAKSLVDDYMDQLVDMDQQLRDFSEQEGQDFMGMSPLAECRYLLGTMFLDEAKKRLQTAKPRSKEEDDAADLLMEAMEHFVNVFVQYPSFNWAGEAMNRSEECRKILDELGFEVHDTTTAKQRHDVAVKQFQNAGVLYNQNQFKEALKAYQNVIASFPDEIPSSLIGLENMIKSAVELSETDPDAAEYWDLYAGAIIGHIAEHFSRFPKKGMLRAGNSLRSMSQYFAGRNKNDLARETMQLYFRLYPNHPQAASSVMAEALKRYQAQPPDLDGAIEYFNIMLDKYAKHPNADAAQRYLADCYKQKGEYELEMAARTNYLARVMKREKPGNDLVVARYSIANMMRDKAVADLREATFAVSEAAKPVEGETEEDAAARAEKAKKDLSTAGKRVAALVNKQINPLIEMLSNPKERVKYEATAKEKEFNDTVLEHCYFDRAFCLSSLHEPKSQEAEFKRQAIESYEKIIAIYADESDDPEKAEKAKSVLPRVLLQLGTLYTTLKAENDAEQEANTKKANDYFSRLSKEFGGSEEARNALFLQGKSLLDLGYTTQGIAKFKEMFASPGGKYTATQLNTAAQVLLENRAYAEADAGFKAALAAAPEGDAGRILRSQIAIGQIQILMARKEWKPAADALAKFVEENPRSANLVFANEMLAEAAVNAAATERDDKARSALYQQAVKAVNALTPYKQGETAKLDLKLRRGAIMDTQAQAEIGFKGEEGAARFLAKASSFYQDLFITRRRDVADPAYLALQEELMYRAPAALARMKKYSDGTAVYADVASECKEYLKEFPKGKHAQEVRTLLNEANVAIRTGEAGGESFFDTLPTEELPDNEVIADDYVMSDEEAGVPAEPEEDEEAGEAGEAAEPAAAEDGDGETAAPAAEDEDEGEAAAKPAEKKPAAVKKAPASDDGKKPLKKKKKKVKKPAPKPAE